MSTIWYSYATEKKHMQQTDRAIHKHIQLSVR